MNRTEMVNNKAMLEAGNSWVMGTKKKKGKMATVYVRPVPLFDK